MNPLRSREVKVFSEALEKIHQQTSLAEFPKHIFEVLEGLIPDAVITMDEFNTATGAARDAINRPPPNYQAWRERLQAIVPVEHPAYHAILAGARDALTIRDFLTDRQLRSTALFSEVFKPIDSHFQIALPLLLPNHVAGITLNRAVNFSDSELAMAGLLAPHIALAHVHAQHFTALHELRHETIPEPDALREIGLTAREAEVLHWMIQGKRDGEIAQVLGNSVRTVQKHVQRILAKMGTETRTDAAVEALRRSGRRPVGHT